MGVYGTNSAAYTSMLKALALNNGQVPDGILEAYDAFLAAFAAVFDANGSLELFSTPGVGAGQGGLKGSIYANVLALSQDSPSPDTSAGSDGVYAFLYDAGNKCLFIEAPAVGNLNGGGRVDIAPGGDNLTAGGNQNRVAMAQPGALGFGHRSGQFTFWDVAGNLINSISYGGGIPTLGGEIGDIYYRTDFSGAGTLPTQYICSTAGAAGAAVWRALGGMIGPWVPAAYSNGWADSGSAVKSRLEGAADVVRLQGITSGGAVGTVAFTLPVGQRPTLPKTVGLTHINGVNTSPWMAVAANGQVTLNDVAAVGAIYLDGVTFSL